MFCNLCLNLEFTVDNYYNQSAYSIYQNIHVVVQSFFLTCYSRFIIFWQIQYLDFIVLQCQVKIILILVQRLQVDSVYIHSLNRQQTEHSNLSIIFCSRSCNNNLPWKTTLMNMNTTTLITTYHLVIVVKDDQRKKLVGTQTIMMSPVIHEKQFRN